MTDSDIIRLFFDRDEQAIAETAEKYGRYCMTIARDILDSEQDAEECVSDVYLKAWNSIPPDEPTSLKAYIAVLTRRLSINRYHESRAAKRNRELEVAFEELGDCVPVPEDTSAEELCALLDSFLEQTPTLDRQLFLGRYWFAHSVKVLAKQYDLTENAVSQRLKRTRAALRDYLTERGYSV